MGKAKTKKHDTKEIVRDSSGQDDFFEKSYEEELEARKTQPVECLGMTFPNDDARREHFLKKLAGWEKHEKGSGKTAIFYRVRADVSNSRSTVRGVYG